MQSIGYTWSPCCYTGENEGDCMWQKPFEISRQTKENSVSSKARSININIGHGPAISEGDQGENGVPHGYEISIGPKGDKKGFEDYEDATEDESMEGWITSPKHRAVIFNEGIWKDIEWTKIGAAAYGPFANVWFSE